MAPTPSTGARPAKPPAHVALLIAFANSIDTDEGTDELTSPAELTHWLVAHDLLSGPAKATSDDLTLALALRGGLNEAFAANHDPERDQDQPSAHSLETAAADLPLRIGGTSSPGLRPVHGGIRGALSLLLVAVQSAVADGSWQRLKICVDSQCEWAFFDASKNRSRNWCEWGCGNRAKTRSYRARRRAETHTR